MSFRDMGYDSAGGVQLRNLLAAATGVKLPPTMAFDHPTPAKLAAHLAARLARREGEEVMGRIAAVEQALASAAPDVRSAAAERLRAIALGLVPPAGGVPGSDEEIFSLIDQELGLA